MPRKRRHEEHENLERWLVSYADFITLLFAFFVVMYAISSVNEGKYRVLSDTLTEAFNKQPDTLEPIYESDPAPSGEPSILESTTATLGEPSVIELLQQTARDNSLGQIADDFEKALLPLIDDELIEITRDDLWVEIELNTSLLFASGTSELEDEAIPVLNRMAQLLKRYPNIIQVEGFTDNLPINTYLYPSNWELSAARAASVVHVFMNSGVEPGRMSAIGYGEYRPVADNATAVGRNKNRRVVLVILADNQARRALDITRNARAKVQE